MKKTVLTVVSLLALLLLPVSCGKTAVEMAVSEEQSAPSEPPEELVSDLQKMSGLPLPDAGTSGGGDRPLIAVTGTYIRGSDSGVLQLWREIYGEEVPFDFTFAPSDRGAELDAWSKSMRVAMTAGKGPDAFILACGYSDLGAEESTAVLFPFPDVERAKRQGVFLPLDDLIAGSETYHPEDHVQAVMDAGKLDGVQLVMPLTYRVPALMADREWVTEKEIAAVETLDDLLYAENPYLAFPVQSLSYSDVFCDMLPCAVDYDTETVRLDAETLAARLKEMRDLFRLHVDQEGAESQLIRSEDRKRLYYEAVSGYFDTEMWAREMGEKTFKAEVGQYHFDPPPQMRLVPIPDKNGDVTAQITSFCAINANTKYPEECWKLLELLYSDGAQDGWIMYEDGIVERASDVGAPQGELLGALGGIPTGIHTRVYQAHASELGKINRARFTGYLDDSYAMIFTRVMWQNDFTDEDYLKAAEDMIREIELNLAE